MEITHEPTDFGNFLIQKGYSPFSVSVKNGKIVYDSPVPFLSTMIPGGIDTRYIKDGIEIIVGLGEHGIPPTLLSPMLRIRYLDNRKWYRYHDQQDTLRVFKKYTNEQILEGILDKNIIFEI